uniref:E3 ubiquitin-protein ligase n=1 Tax=Ciona intestinalis TaxID=7719 RepID=F6SQ79_CIOIN
MANDSCCICLDDFSSTLHDVKELKCKHKFHVHCIEQALKQKSFCPMCNTPVGAPCGNQPIGGRMTWSMNNRIHLPGYDNFGAIVIRYSFSGGTQQHNHPHPGQRYSGTTRIAYLPDSHEGQEVLALLTRAFDARLIFTVGRSITSGRDNQITWNDIHHKTRTHGGAHGYGYPDPEYLKRVKEDLRAKGIY